MLAKVRTCLLSNRSLTSQHAATILNSVYLGCEVVAKTATLRFSVTSSRDVGQNRFYFGFPAQTVCALGLSFPGRE
jgi:hypothetical protein